jgi:hypothetical protein
MTEQLAIVQRIFRTAVERQGSAAHLAAHLGVTLQQMRSYVAGEEMPSDLVLLRVVNLILQDLPSIRGQFSKAAWTSLALPRD